eukprot:8223874-Alexandrium_andersonii.AAC.1
MSASLVGSEMCIRDRPRAPRAPRAPCPGRVPRSPPVGGPRAQLRALRIGAVSYTHLTLPTICSV